MSAKEEFEKWWPSVGQTIGKVAAWEAWQAAQGQSSKPCPYIVNGGEGTSWCRLAAKPTVNKQLLEAGLIIRRLLDEAVDDFYYETDPDGLIEEARAAIAAAQEQGGGE